jgi:uncharacterized ferritin-like protein (DUF455 family)
VELREFAEQILCATTLEEKLIDPPGERLTDERPGPAWNFAAEPGRPAELRFKSSGSDKAGTAGKAEFPGLHGLDNEAGRGKVLHFFANHELLATELMALALLRFPDAPPAFRRGVLHTLREEQEHVRLYLDRMKACGIRFGELPVSGYFWRSVAPMRQPMDFVTGLSLTFEQANLDFARVFSRGFAEAGDLETAALLQRILHDEIGHVAHGLKWFRQWKDPSSSDWDAFCGSLRFPLSPQRAKGVEFNLEARRAAGGGGPQVHIAIEQIGLGGEQLVRAGGQTGHHRVHRRADVERVGREGGGSVGLAQGGLGDGGLGRHDRAGQVQRQGLDHLALIGGHVR